MTLDEERLARGDGGLQLDEILAVDQAVERLAQVDPRQAEVAEMRYFAGLSVEETAETLGVSPRTVKRNWAIAKGWIQTHWKAGGMDNGSDSSRTADWKGFPGAAVRPCESAISPDVWGATWGAGGSIVRICLPSRITA